ncbi:hypothetical protein BJX68DRAFT_233011 [Aspergillus pseudodeflectus]|uniref:Uncharacterized protein n=1 Tax=Aspergillus pseudodeflectus TaxID=176178 RepID=A0ABR4KPI4_9EURO
MSAVQTLRNFIPPLACAQGVTLILQPPSLLTQPHRHCPEPKAADARFYELLRMSPSVSRPSRHLGLPEAILSNGPALRGTVMQYLSSRLVGRYRKPYTPGSATFS